MKKTKEILFILSVLCLALMLFGCGGGGGGSSTKESTLTLQNGPDGNWGVQVYPSNTLPTNNTEYREMTSPGKLLAGSIALYPSPIPINWLGSIESGSHLVVISKVNPTESRFGLAQFDSKGNATINWNIMTDYFLLP